MRVLPFLSLLITTVSAAYTIQDDYSPENFANMFDFYTGNDPTNGYVNYIDQNTAQSSGLYKAINGQVHIGVDSKIVASGRGRDSVRISSKTTYNHGLIILDLAHMPGGQCGTWPAFWLLGPNWPTSGEVDIIEGVNSQTANSMAVHTNSGCSITNTGNFAGSLRYSDCDSYSTSQPNNVGCSIGSNSDESYGTGFNSAGGGVYATEWTSEAISVWHFPRSAIPADVVNGVPDPSNWGLPSGRFTGACDIDDHVVNQQIVFDITFCGGWAGEVWSQDSTCSSKASTCQDYVQNNPSAFTDTFWSINSLRVYQDNGGGPVAPTISNPTTSSSIYSNVPPSATFSMPSDIEATIVATSPATTTGNVRTTNPAETTPTTTITFASETTSPQSPTTATTLETSIIPAPTSFEPSSQIPLVPSVVAPDTISPEFNTQWNPNWGHHGPYQTAAWGGDGGGRPSPSAGPRDGQGRGRGRGWGRSNHGHPARHLHGV